MNCILMDTKNIRSIGNLPNLKKLYLRAIKKTPLEFINNMKGLHSLSLLLGGRSDLNEIETSNVKELTIDWVIGFNDLFGVLKLNKLEKLKLSALKQLKTINIEQVNKSLKDLWIFSCKSLAQIHGLDKMKSLKVLGLIQASISFEDFIQLPLPESLKVLDFCTFKHKKDKEIMLTLKSMGYNT